MQQEKKLSLAQNKRNKHKHKLAHTT